jgi:hypothetical protein
MDYGRAKIPGKGAQAAKTSAVVGGTAAGVAGGLIASGTILSGTGVGAIVGVPLIVLGAALTTGAAFISPQRAALAGEAEARHGLSRKGGQEYTKLVNQPTTAVQAAASAHLAKAAKPPVFTTSAAHMERYSGAIAVLRDRKAMMEGQLLAQAAQQPPPAPTTDPQAVLTLVAVLGGLGLLAVALKKKRKG